MGLFSRKPKSGEHFIVIFDIGSGSIGGAFVSIDGNRVPEVIFSTRRDIPVQEKLNFQRFLDSMIKTLEEMFIVMQKAGGGVRVDQAFCILASPWYASQTRIVRYNQATPFIITDKVLTKLLQKEVDLFRSSKLFSRSKVGDELPEIMESKNIQMKLNGYEVKNPYGKRAVELEIALYISMIPANIFRSINKSVTKFWSVPKVHFSSFAFTAFDAIRDVFSNESSFLFMDIAGEVTDISIAKDNVLLESISFPAGKNMLIRALAEGMKTTTSLAAAEMNLFLEGRSSREHAKQVEEILRSATKDWLLYLEDALAQFAMEFPIPRTLFYTSDDNVIKWFGDSIDETNFAKFSSEDGSFVVRSLGNQFLSKFVQVQEPSFQDPFLAIETMFANKLTTLLK
jgi:hypothetical protein